MRNRIVSLVIVALVSVALVSPARMSTVEPINTFTEMIVDGTKTLQVEMPEIRIVEEPFNDAPDAPLAVAKLPAFFGGSESYLISVRADFLDTASDTTLRHWAIRSLADIKLEHVGNRNISEGEKQKQAESVVYVTIGPDLYYEFVREFLDQHPGDDPTLTNLDEPDLREALALTYDPKRQPPKEPLPRDAGPEFSELATQIMAYHEKQTGLRYRDTAPSITLTDALPEGTFAQYDAVAGEILLNATYADYRVTALLKDLTATKLPDGESGHRLLALRNILSHELGHYFTHQLVKQKKDSWLAPSFVFRDPISKDNLGTLIVIEGLAEYFGRIFDNQGGESFPEKGWESPWITEENFHQGGTLRWLCYCGGHDLVKRVIEKHGAEAGINYLLTTPLEVKAPGLSSVRQYQNTALGK